MTLIDEYTRQCLAIRVERRTRRPDVIDTLGETMLVHGVPEHVGSDNGPEMTSKLVRGWLARVPGPRLLSPAAPDQPGGQRQGRDMHFPGTSPSVMAAPSHGTPASAGRRLRAEGLQ